jgi:hypothetical protein
MHEEIISSMVSQAKENRRSVQMYRIYKYYVEMTPKNGGLGPRS